jgi:hypothetical protein
VFAALPFGSDLAVMGLAIQDGGKTWAIPLSRRRLISGALLTYWMGATLGEAGLSRPPLHGATDHPDGASIQPDMPAGRLDAVRRRAVDDPTTLFDAQPIRRRDACSHRPS